MVIMINDDDRLEFSKNEPIKYDPKYLKIGIEYETTEHIAWRIEKEHYDNFNSISKEKRTDILKRFSKGGITIGELAKVFKINNSVVVSIIFLNIKTTSRYTLNEESL